MMEASELVWMKKTCAFLCNSEKGSVSDGLKNVTWQTFAKIFEQKCSFRVHGDGSISSPLKNFFTTLLFS